MQAHHKSRRPPWRRPRESVYWPVHPVSFLARSATRQLPGSDLPKLQAIPCMHLPGYSPLTYHQCISPHIQPKPSCCLQPSILLLPILLLLEGAVHFGGKTKSKMSIDRACTVLLSFLFAVQSLKFRCLLGILSGSGGGQDNWKEPEPVQRRLVGELQGVVVIVGSFTIHQLWLRAPTPSHPFRYVHLKLPLALSGDRILYV